MSYVPSPIHFNIENYEDDVKHILEIYFENNNDKETSCWKSIIKNWKNLDIICDLPFEYFKCYMHMLSYSDIDIHMRDIIMDKVNNNWCLYYTLKNSGCDNDYLKNITKEKISDLYKKQDLLLKREQKEKDFMKELMGDW